RRREGGSGRSGSLRHVSRRKDLPACPSPLGWSSGKRGARKRRVARVLRGPTIDPFRASGDNARVEGGSGMTPDHLDRVMKDPSRLVHFVGVGGTGMSALAQYRAIGGGRTSGSDRTFDQGLADSDRVQLERLGVILRRQDGSGVSSADLVVVSTAVE